MLKKIISRFKKISSNTNERYHYKIHKKIENYRTEYGFFKITFFGLKDL